MLIRLLLLPVRTVARLLLFILLAVVGVLVWRNFKRQLMQRQDKAGQPAAAKSERVISCAYCQVHVPESEAVGQDGRFFCCDEHRDAYRRNAG